MILRSVAARWPWADLGQLLKASRDLPVETPKIEDLSSAKEELEVIFNDSCKKTQTEEYMSQLDALTYECQEEQRYSAEMAEFARNLQERVTTLESERDILEHEAIQRQQEMHDMLLMLQQRLEDLEMEYTAEHNERLRAQNDLENARNLITNLEHELSEEKSERLLLQRRLNEDSAKSEELSDFVLNYKSQQQIQYEEHQKEKDALINQLETAHSRIRVLQSTVDQVTAKTNEWYESPRNISRNDIESPKNLEDQLQELRSQKQTLSQEYSKLPRTNIRRREEIEGKLDHVEKEIGRIRMRLKKMNYF